MPKKSRQSHAQKRKQKLAKRNRRQAPEATLPYTGNKYKSPHFVEPLFETEQGIFEAFVVSGRTMTDNAVEEELQGLIDELRQSPVAELIYRESAEDGEPTGWVAPMVLQHWRRLLESRGLPARDDLIGILRTILGSLDVWRSKSASSRGYLNYLEGFMGKMGVSMKLVTDDGQPVIESPPDELYEVGEMWLAGSPEARHRFTALANELLEQGQPQRVVDACQKLLRTIDSPTRPEFPILSELSIRAQKSAQKISNSEFAPGIKNFISRLIGR
jgi:hypothetical protein